VFSNLTRNKCPLCFQLSSDLKNLISTWFGNKFNCQHLNEHINEKDKERVAKINNAAPNCSCEQYRMSKHSPNVVGNNEALARFVFSPIHVDKKGRIKASIFSHVFNVGCSIQRDDIAKPEELVNFAKEFLADDKMTWEGVLLANCNDLKSIKANSINSRAVCVYDTASATNPAHGEISQSQYIIEEADVVELRSELFKAFGGGQPILPNDYRQGTIWEQLPSDLKRPSKISSLLSVAKT